MVSWSPRICGSCRLVSYKLYLAYFDCFFRAVQYECIIRTEITHYTSVISFSVISSYASAPSCLSSVQCVSFRYHILARGWTVYRDSTWSGTRELFSDWYLHRVLSAWSVRVKFFPPRSVQTQRCLSDAKT